MYLLPVPYFSSFLTRPHWSAALAPCAKERALSGHAKQDILPHCFSLAQPTVNFNEILNFGWPEFYKTLKAGFLYKHSQFINKYNAHLHYNAIDKKVSRLSFFGILSKNTGKEGSCMSKEQAQGLSELAQTVFSGVTNASRMQDKKLQQALKKLGIHPAQYGCLAVICAQEGITLSQLAERLQIENSTMSVSVRRMEKAGLIQRRADETDSRVSRLFATAYGRAQFEKSKKLIDAYVQQCFGAFSEKELSTFERLLRQLAAQMEGFAPAV